MRYQLNRIGRSLTVIATALLIVGIGARSAIASEFGIAPNGFDLVMQNQDGSTSTQAGGHPYSVTSRIDLKTAPDEDALRPAGANLRTAEAALPPGLVGNPYAVPQCTVTEFLKPDFFHHCPDNTQVGVAKAVLDVNYNKFNRLALGAIYNLAPAVGQPAAFGFWLLTVPVIVVPKLRSDGDYGLTVVGRNLDETLPVISTEVTFWGVPASPVHDSERGTLVGTGTTPIGCSSEGASVPCVSNVKPQAFLTAPVNCAAGAMTTTLFAESWRGETDSQSSISHDSLGNPVGMTGCERVPFNPSVSAQPSVESAESPSGLKFELEVPDAGVLNPTGLTQAEIKRAVVRLPQGMTINPSAGEGLGGCKPADYAREAVRTPPGEGCPNSSKLGTVKIDTPLLNEPVEGSLFLAEPDDPATSTPGAENPFDSLLGIYIVARNPERGIIIKVAGKVVPDPVTGQLVATFDDLPQLPFSKFTLSFREGQRSPLATPPACGTYTAKAELTPWSAAKLDDPAPGEVADVDSFFTVTSGVGGGACPSGGTPPFHPSVQAGTVNNAAGSYSPFYLRIGRGDGEQELTRFSTVLPPGLTGNLTGIPFCSEAAIEAARHVTGRQELGAPSCPASSEIGHTLVGAGVGGVLAFTPGKLYLAGPYRGSALSMVSITSATVGPFDLGTVVIRFALKINPVTAQVEVDATGSDPIPHIIDGIVVHVRDIHVYVDRAKFILNPTSCAGKSIANTITGAGADFTNPADQTSVAVASRFQAADCASLGFKPTFKTGTSARTSRANGASLNVKLAFPTRGATQANIRLVKVDLPKQLPSRLTTLQKACTDATFNRNPAECPAASRVGVAKAITPILPVPLVGPAYFVSHGGAAFPELVAVLQGYGITIDLHGETFISKQGITSSTFKTVPDQPVTSFELNLPQGKYSALAANGNLCTQKLKMPTSFIAQNGATLRQSTPIAVKGCPHKRSKGAGVPMT